MELRQLVYFEAVVRCGGFTRAAEQLHVAQSAVSAQIQQLESELGVTLLARTTRRVSLTHAGELFLGRAVRVLSELEGARGDLAELSGVLRGRVTLGATQIFGPIDLSASLSQFHGLHPGVALVLRSGLISSLLGELDTGEVDLILGPLHEDLPSRYSPWPMFDEEVVLVTPPGHPLGYEKSLTLRDLRDEPFVCLPRDSGLRRILDEAAENEGFQPSVQFETHSPSSVRELVNSGLGVALLARSAAQTPGPPVSIHTVDPSPSHPSVGLIHHRDRRLTPAAQALRRHLARRAVIPAKPDRAG